MNRVRDTKASNYCNISKTIELHLSEYSAFLSLRCWAMQSHLDRDLTQWLIHWAEPSFPAVIHSVSRFILASDVLGEIMSSLSLTFEQLTKGFRIIETRFEVACRLELWLDTQNHCPSNCQIEQSAFQASVSLQYFRIMFISSKMKDLREVLATREEQCYMRRI